MINAVKLFISLGLGVAAINFLYKEITIPVINLVIETRTISNFLFCIAISLLLAYGSGIFVQKLRNNKIPISQTAGNIITGVVLIGSLLCLLITP